MKILCFLLSFFLYIFIFYFCTARSSAGWDVVSSPVRGEDDRDDNSFGYEKISSNSFPSPSKPSSPLSSRQPGPLFTRLLCILVISSDFVFCTIPPCSFLFFFMSFKLCIYFTIFYAIFFVVAFFFCRSNLGRSPTVGGADASSPRSVHSDNSFEIEEFRG